MLVEGKGKVPPAPIRVVMTTQEMLCINASVDTIDRYASRLDSWGKGLIGRKEAIVAGKCGEHAAREVANRVTGKRFPPVDFMARSYGDGGVDLRFGRVSVQVKTRRTSNTNLVRADRPICGDVTVFCSWNGKLDVDVLGWIPCRSIQSMPVKPSHRGEWGNYVIDDRDLLPMCRLWAELEWRCREAS